MLIVDYWPSNLTKKHIGQHVEVGLKLAPFSPNHNSESGARFFHIQTTRHLRK